ncbi:ABC transporter permease [Clostridium swellfunianum]|uniref:ABC transporter permease n=1 Tax=Clostridium swellfunianum TaxID=1367462 RepID=UPI00202DC3DA|nr:ABC transporter permease [Clostridium swellfunianum]MCM0650115.1 ABC transporter permease [Clostridium swellfunianum]
MKVFRTMLITELKLSLRGMDMFIFAICMPVVVTIILGVIYGNNPAFPGAAFTFLEQSFAAISTIAICAGGVMGLPLVLSEYRHRKILKRFKITPVSPSMILAVEGVIYALYAIASLILVYLTAKVFFNFQFRGSWINFLGAYALVMISMFSIGFMVGGIAKNTKTAGVIAGILYFPMLIFSGATLPYEVMPAALQKMADIFPLTQGIKFLKSASLNLSIDNAVIPIYIIGVLPLVCSGIAIKFFKWE